VAINRKRADSAYGLTNPLQSLAPEPIVAQRVPTTQDFALPGTVWLDQSAGPNVAFMLLEVTANTANWLDISVGADPVTATAAFPTSTVVINAKTGAAVFTGFTTAAGVTQVFTITNSFVTTASTTIVSANNAGLNTALMVTKRVEPLDGSFEITLENEGIVALNGDVHIGFIILN
jgi:hypothetical protein